MNETDWCICRAAIRKRLKHYVNPADLDDATQDAVIRAASLMGRTGKHWSWCAVVAAKRQARYCRAGYRPAYEPAKRERWEDRIDDERLIGAQLDWEQMVERGLISAQVMRLQSACDR